jgi:hypothetical protein
VAPAKPVSVFAKAGGHRYVGSACEHGGGLPKGAGSSGCGSASGGFLSESASRPSADLAESSSFVSYTSSDQHSPSNRSLTNKISQKPASSHQLGRAGSPDFRLPGCAPGMEFRSLSPSPVRSQSNNNTLYAFPGHASPHGSLSPNNATTSVAMPMNKVTAFFPQSCPRTSKPSPGALAVVTSFPRHGPTGVTRSKTTTALSDSPRGTIPGLRSAYSHGGFGHG